MKRILITTLVLFTAVAMMAQSPNAFNYQGIARDLSGNPVTNQNVGLRVSILQGTVSGTEVFKELHLIATNNSGLFNIQIGKGTPVSGEIETIDWGTGSYFLKIEMDTEGGSNYQLIGTNQLLSVPYALYAENSGNEKWKSNETAIYYKTGKVGIGVENPIKGLHIRRVTKNGVAIGQAQLLVEADSGSDATIYLGWYPDSTYNMDDATFWRINNCRPNGNFSISEETDNYPGGTSAITRLYITKGEGNVGIGKSNPLAKLDVNGEINVNHNKIRQVDTPVDDYDAVNKAYVDALLDKILQLEADLGVKDIDGNSYKAVKIGTQVWMAENLKTTKYNDGTTISNVTESIEWTELTSGAYCWYGHDINKKTTYGALYNWHAVNTGKLCPIGWHVPSDTEWATLTNFLGGESIAGGKMKSDIMWNYPNTGATNSSGFNALPGGHRHYLSGAWYLIDANGYWWSRTSGESPEDTSKAWFRTLFYDTVYITRNLGSKTYGFSVRCIKD